MKRRTTLSLFSPLMLAACSSSGSMPDALDISAPEPLPATTSGSIALTNLNFRIETAERLLAASEDDGLRAELISLLTQRARFLGTFEDYDRADVSSAQFLERAPRDQRALLTRASVLGGLHRFEEAHEILSRIDGADDLVFAARLPMWIATLHPGPLVEDARSRASRNPSFATYVTVGSALAAIGDFEAADEAFLEAAAAYRDVSPFAIAWLQFQRGVMWSERAGDAERGRRLYADAVSRLPAYVTANVHLAEIEREHDLARAIERLESVANQTSDPEPMGLLGELYLEVGRRAEAEQWITRARELYVDLLRRHRSAFADHGAEFYLGVGADPEQAFELARDNLALRGTERAYSLAIRAALAAGRPDQACIWAQEADVRTKSGIELTEDLPAGLEACN